ncbi:MAG: hypothetical protein E6700_10295 [Winkia neuii]|uniref:Uncharacterized protein n=1 Tax=Winkia neuii TaxID=33007 RepID=A0A2I1IQZ2_9ACTO|nr:hypothetical protein [Winkia neuii]OFJ70395.1 hypothetical protein HMPREF2851_10095 [Actinomyces sp. HMSC064C12]OFK02698.1 hypothetical protein HMPREF2835_05555 [Actinomyces sp. HMSC072A03]OFT56120.1 hypothetical protein HMPREF3152_02645 [Actinomyces sp. HMSC06A08]MDK8100588.1 hypothetical protein [Winkia neuii]MDU3135939.1 hypothetical protein [Winkia neuii]
MSARFRRPAMLEPEDAENIVGDKDPALRSDIAHTTAQLLVGTYNGYFDKPLMLGDATSTPEVLIPRLREIAASGNVDLVAELWSGQPATTLPGALWRLYLLREWARRDKQTTLDRYNQGLQAPKASHGVDTPPPFKQAFGAINQVLGGAPEDTEEPLAWVGSRLVVAAQVMRILAAGAAGPDWITSDQDALADQVTRRAAALTKTAKDFEEAAKAAANHNLN